jgi:hypothetical protein
MCAELRLDGIAHLSGPSSMDGEQSSLRECGPRDFQTKDPNEMARFGEERRLVVAKSLVVDVIFPTWYRTTGNKTSATLPMRRRSSDVLARFHVLLICWRVDWVATEKGKVNMSSESCSQVRDGVYLEEKTAVVDLPDLSAGEFITLQDSVHLVEVSGSLKWRDMRVF